jgi:8-oxo-dGTP diphosphatase
VELLQPRSAAEHTPCRGVVAVIARGPRLLVIRRAAGVAAPGRLCFPGGAVEGDESEPHALQRELQEELYLPVVPLGCLWRSTTPWGVLLAWWAAAVQGAWEPVPNPCEVAEVYWATPDELLQHPDLLESNRDFLQLLVSGQIAWPE